MTSPVPLMTQEQEAVRQQVAAIRLKIEQLSLRPPESRAQMKAERKRLYHAINDLLMRIWGCVPYENLIAPQVAAAVAQDLQRRLKIE